MRRLTLPLLLASLSACLLAPAPARAEDDTEGDRRGWSLASGLSVGRVGVVSFDASTDGWRHTGLVLDQALRYTANGWAGGFLYLHLDLAGWGSAAQAYRWLDRTAQRSGAGILLYPLGLFLPFAATTHLAGGVGVTFWPLPGRPALFIEGGLTAGLFVDGPNGRAILGWPLLAGVGLEVSDRLSIVARGLWEPRWLHGPLNHTRDEVLSGWVGLELRPAWTQVRSRRR